jgi:hypothetical protein
MKVNRSQTGYQGITKGWKGRGLKTLPHLGSQGKMEVSS